MKNIIRTLRSSFYDPREYASILGKPFSYSLKYFVFLAVLVSVLAVGYKTYSIASFFNQAVPEVLEEIRSSFPDDLVVEIRNGQVRTNADEPYGLMVPRQWRGGEDGIRNIVVINTRDEPTLERLEKYRTAILVGKDQVAFLDGENPGSIRVQSLRGISDIRIDKNALNGVLDTVLSYRFAAIALVLLMALFAFFLTFLFQYLLYLVLGAFMVALALQARDQRFNYVRSYRIGLHAMTPAIAYEMITILVPALHVPFFFTVIMALTVYVNFPVSQTMKADAEPTPLGGTDPSGGGN